MVNVIYAEQDYILSNYKLLMVSEFLDLFRINLTAFVPINMGLISMEYFE